MFLDSLDTRKGSLFKFNKNLSHKKSATHPLIGPNGLVFLVNKNAEFMADSLEAQFTENPGPNLLEITQILNSYRKEKTFNSGLLTTTGTLQKINQTLVKKKAPGYDDQTLLLDNYRKNTYWH